MLSREMQRSVPVTKVRRRSEIDRRLDSLVPAGRLKDSHTTTIVKVRGCGRVLRGLSLSTRHPKTFVRRSPRSLLPDVEDTIRLDSSSRLCAT